MPRNYTISAVDEAERIFEKFKKRMPDKSFSYSLALAAEKWMKDRNHTLSAVREDGYLYTPDLIYDDMNEWKQFYKSLSPEEKTLLERSVGRLASLLMRI